MISEEEIKMIYQHCHHNDPKGLYPVEIDIIEFSRKLEEYLDTKKKHHEEKRELDFLSKKAPD